MLKERPRHLALGTRGKRHEFQLGDSDRASWKKWPSRWALKDEEGFALSS